VSLIVQVPVVTVVTLVEVAAAVAVGVAVAVATAAVGAGVALGATAAPPHAASRRLALASGTAIRFRYREVICSSAVCSSDLTRRKGDA
jgi:hypothetical protein